MFKKSLVLGATLALVSAAVVAQVKVGVIVGSTGPQASLGVPMKNTVSILPATLGGQPVKYIVLDDASDPTISVKLARKLITEDKVDIIFGTSSLAGTTAIAHVATEHQAPVIGLAPTGPEVAKNPWVFTTPQPLPVMMSAVVDDMKSSGVKTVAYIGFADGWGDVVLAGIKPAMDKAGIKLVTDERYSRVDTSVVGPVLKIMAAKPDAVVIGGSGTGSALAHVTLAERNYKGKVYHNHAVINKDFLRIGGARIEGAIAPTGPVMVAEQLSDNNPIKPVALKYIQALDTTFGQDSRNAFSGYSYDAYLLADNAVRAATTKAKPGTPEFRKALRDALEESKEVVGVHGVYTMTSADHSGVDERSRVLVQVENGKWKLVK